MKNIYFIISILLILNSCVDNQEQKNNIKDTVFVKLDDTLNKKNNKLPELKDSVIKIHIFKTGETLWGLSKKIYGNRHYSSILLIYNDIDDVHNIKNGTPIKIPPLSYMLKDPKLGLFPIFEHEIDTILQARKLFMKHEKMLYKLRKGVERKNQLVLPKDTKADIQKAANLIDKAIISLKKSKSSTIRIPVKMIRQLKYVASNLKSLSKGKHDGKFGYDLDMVHQNLIHAIRNGILRAENN